MRTNIAKSATSIRQDYLQQYLKQFLRRVHPDLFQHHPKEQLQNSASLQDLLPIVSLDKNKTASLPSNHTSSSPAETTKRLTFYYKNKDAGQKSNTSAGSTGAQEGLMSVEHTLPLAIDPRIPSSTDSGASSKQDILEREVKSWEMVQSFVDLCRKVGVPVKTPDQIDISDRLEESITNAKTATRANQQKRAAPQKPVSEVFQEELQSSFSGSSGHVGSLSASSSSLTGRSDIRIKSGSSLDTISDSHLGKIGGTAPALDAQLMIQSNSLLFKSPMLSSAKLGKTIRTWIHWQEEDQHLHLNSANSSSDHDASAQKPFRLGDWWRKVPIMILSSSTERAEMLKAATANPAGKDMDRQSTKGMLIVDQDMSKQEITDYLEDNLFRVQREYQEMLKEALPSQQRPRQDTGNSVSAEKASVSADAALYIERMRARTQLKTNRPTNKRWR
ncbi:hypothetical protein BGZ97_010153 [Linnemannia gamsii]|uniref:DUF4460 domain-containing protein n=1 Tax=Linnemannia gamsii TaxID=64522 RepID=A0A9P6R6I2_9FUNG|nr:hypothetical protein BGZ97_010153 [Linnemannia gamsii]